MHATAVEKITPQSKGPLETPRRILPPAINFLLRWGLLALIAIVVVPSTVLGLVQKWPWPRQLDYAGIFWTLLSVKWGIFGVTLVVSVLYLGLNLRFAARNIEFVDGESFFNKAFTHPADASRTINVDISPRLLVFAIDFAILALCLEQDRDSRVLCPGNKRECRRRCRRRRGIEPRLSLQRRRKQSTHSSSCWQIQLNSLTS